MGDLTKDISRSEIICRCGCGLDRADPELLDKLQQVRDIIQKDWKYYLAHTTNKTLAELEQNWKDVPMEFVSVCRCANHNKAEGGVSGSAHTPQNDGFTKAADISCTEGTYRFFLLQALIKIGFLRIEPKSTWIHADIDMNKPHPCVFYE